MQLWIKKLEVDIFAHTSQAERPQGFYHNPPGSGKLFLCPDSIFLKIF